MIHFKRLPSDILPTVDNQNAVLAETSSGDFVLIDSDGARTIALKIDIKTAVDEAVEAIHKEMSDKADQSVVREIAEQYNKAIEVINNLSERLAALESNYDPTVIK